MADRSSAYLFSEIFKLIDEEVDDPAKRTRLARKFWEMTSDYDFSWYQLECDPTLIRLGLARKGVNPNFPEDGEVTIYFGEDGW